MFVLADRITRLYRYEIAYKDEEGNDIIDKVLSGQEKERLEQKLLDKEVQFATTEIDQTENEWFEGLYFASYDEAREVFSAGKEAYLQEQSLKEMTDNLRLRADIDFIAVMGGIDI